MEDRASSRDQSIAEPELRITATAVSRGIGIGRVVFLNGEETPAHKTKITHSQIDREIERFRVAVAHSIGELSELTAARINDSPESAADIFGVHQLILEGSSFISNIESAIRDDLVNTEWAVKQVTEEFVTHQKSVSDPHLRDKYLDIQDVGERILRALVMRHDFDASTIGSVFVVSELMPSRLWDLAKKKPSAVILEHGGWTSHTSILARELKLPVVTGVRNIHRIISNGDQVIVDGIEGQIIVRPDETTIRHYSVIETNRKVSDDLPAAGKKTTFTLDGQEIIIRANVEMPDAYQSAAKAGARGIGLYRSEVIFNQLHGFPSEADQIAAYSRIANLTGETGVRIRTFDVGVGQLDGDAQTWERNPSLGLRSIRLNLTDSTYFRTQIRAILQAAHNRNIDIVLPMISGVGDILRLREIITDEWASLIDAGVQVGNPAVGAMIEVPSAVLTANEIARHVDFMCLGTNDLVQYLLAVDRDNETVADWYQTLHPAVIRVIREVISAADNAGIPISVCGETAGSAFYVPVLIGLGARELSMNVNSISQIRSLISGITLKEAVQLVDSLEPYETADEIESILREHYLRNWSHLFPPGILSSKYQ